MYLFLFTDECKDSICLGGQCKIENHKYMCTCPFGFELKNNICEDVNECIFNPCPLNSQCINNRGSFKCACINGTIADSNGNCRSPGDCITDADCSETGKCQNNRCINPCDVNNCGNNAECLVSKHQAVCECPPDSQGDPYKECVKFQCIKDADCNLEEACVNYKCSSPCNIPRACGKNADCFARSHIGYCSCSPGFTGDPLLGCVPIQYCTDDSRCSSGTKCIDNLCAGELFNLYFLL